MKFYSVGYVRLKSLNLTEKCCPICEKKSLQIKLLGKYINVLSLPLILLKKRAIYYCSSCKYTIKIQEDDKNAQEIIDTLS